MPANDSIGFWSYTHRDNELEGGRIRRLAAAIQNEYELLTGDSIIIFVDSSEIEWGQEWRQVIDGALLRTAFFIPIITPLYLRSEQCRREFVEFVGRASRAHARDLILPILYADTQQVADPDTDDEVARLIRDIQSEDWRSLRLAEETSPDYRSAVNRLANRLVGVAASFAERPIEADEVEEPDDLGVLDQIGIAESNVETWGDLLTSVGQDLTEFGEILTQTTEHLQASDRRGGGARGRLVILNNFAQEISLPVERIQAGGASFSRSAIETDPGVQVLIRRGPAEAKSDAREQVEEFFGQVKNLSGEAIKVADVLRGFVQSIDGAQSISRVVRSPLRKLRSGLSGIIDGATVLDSWSRLIDEVTEDKDPA
jgi:hypothetical protein